MKEQSVSFWWDVAMDGYKWIKTRAVGSTDEEWYLTTGTPLGPIGYMRQRYQAFEEAPGLFRIFADTLPTQEGILEFASKYGFLTRDNSTYQPGCDRSTAQGKIELPREASNSGEPAIGEGEPFTLWIAEIQSMHEAVVIWDAIQELDGETLSEHITWKEDGVYYQGKSPNSEPISTRSFRPEFLQWFRRGNLFEPAILWLAGRLNARIESGKIQSMFQWSPEKPDQLHLVYIPDNLIEAMWLQFTLAVDESKDYRQCLQCGTWFELSPAKARTNRLFCSGACRSRNYREKKLRAQELASEGVDIEQIAAELGTDVETARGWIAKE
jgi:hypothetical protein